MFDDFLRNCKMEDKIKPSKKRVKKNVAAVKSLIEKEDNSMTKRKLRYKPLIIAAAITITFVVSLLTVNAAMKGDVVKFFMGGQKIEGEYYDYVDRDGFRHISFEATLPIYEENFAVIYDVDAPREKAVRVITDDTDHDFMEKLRQYLQANKEYFEAVDAWHADPEHNTYPGDIGPDSETVGLVFKDSELCLYRLNYDIKDSGFEFNGGGSLGGEFMTTGTAEGHPSGVSEKNMPNECSYDWENETKTLQESFYYYVGKE